MLVMVQNKDGVKGKIRGNMQGFYVSLLGFLDGAIGLYIE